MNLRAEIRPELWEAITKPYESRIYSNATLEAIHYLSSVLRERTNIDGDGVSLVGQALGSDNPRLRINKFQTETEKNEQKGFEQIVRGIYQGIRNPRSHEQFEDTQEAADAIILFINYILGIISQAKAPFTIEEWKERVFDPDFVASDRYAKLLASEVPPKKYIEALITIYRNKKLGDGEQLRFIFNALIERIGDDQLGDFNAVVSDELKVIQNDGEIKTILQILPKRLWPRLDEAARIRIENKLIRSIKAGKYDPIEPKNVPGWLGTWAQGYVKHFTLKYELYEVLLNKLRSSEEEQNYVAQFFLGKLPDTLDPTTGKDWYEYQRDEYIDAICTAVSYPDPFESSMLRGLLTETRNLPEDWRKLMIEKLKPLEESDPDFYKKVVESEGIPL